MSRNANEVLNEIVQRTVAAKDEAYQLRGDEAVVIARSHLSDFAYKVDALTRLVVGTVNKAGYGGQRISYTFKSEINSTILELKNIFKRVRVTEQFQGIMLKLLDEYGQALINFVDNPSKENREKASALIEQLLELEGVKIKAKGKATYKPGGRDAEDHPERPGKGDEKSKRDTAGGGGQPGGPGGDKEKDKEKKRDTERKRNGDHDEAEDSEEEAKNRARGPGRLPLSAVPLRRTLSAPTGRRPGVLPGKRPTVPPSYYIPPSGPERKGDFDFDAERKRKVAGEGPRVPGFGPGSDDFPGGLSPRSQRMRREHEDERRRLNYERIIAELRAQIRELTLMNSNLLMEKTESEENSRTSIARLNSRYQTEHTDLMNDEEEIIRLREELAEAQAELKNARESLGTSKGDEKGLREKLSVKEENIRRLENALREAEAKFIESNIRFNEIRARLEAETKSHQEDNLRREGDIRTLQQRIQDLSRELSNQQTEFERERQRLIETTRNKDLHEIEREREQLREREAAFERQIRDFQREKEVERLTVIQLERELQQLREIEKAGPSAPQGKESKRVGERKGQAEAETRQRELDAQIARLEIQLKVSSQTQEQFRGDNDRLARELAEERNRVRALENENLRIQSTLRDASMDLRRSQADFEQQLKRLQEQNQENLRRAQEDLKRLEEQRRADVKQVQDQRQQELAQHQAALQALQAQHQVGQAALQAAQAQRVIDQATIQAAQAQRAADQAEIARLTAELRRMTARAQGAETNVGRLGPELERVRLLYRTQQQHLDTEHKKYHSATVEIQQLKAALAARKG